MESESANPGDGQASSTSQEPWPEVTSLWVRAPSQEEKPGLGHIKVHPRGRPGGNRDLKTIIQLWKTPDIIQVNSEDCQKHSVCGSGPTVYSRAGKLSCPGTHGK